MTIKDVVAAKFAQPASRIFDSSIRDIVHEILKEAGYASPAELQGLRDELRDVRGQVTGNEKRAATLAQELEKARADADPRVSALSKKMDEVEQRLAARIAALEARITEQATSTSAIRSELAAARGGSGDGRLSTLEAQLGRFPTIVEERLSALSAQLEARITVLPAALENRLDDLEAKVQQALSAEPKSEAKAETKAEPKPRAPKAPKTESSAATAAEALAGSGSEEPLSAGEKGDCKLDSCGKPVRAKGFCSSHYQQWRRGSLKGYVGVEGVVTEGGMIVDLGVENAGEPYVVRNGAVMLANQGAA
ncbi:MAG TPA: hypothetical protein PLA94_01205 [Myxococcota bacterium]|nr:hypothetical protein [Myxococcota bacterium]